MRIITPFINTLGFLTRLGPARVISDEDMAKCMACMPAVGLVLGAAVVLPFGLGLFSGSPWVQAWLMVGLSILLTRGLHYDGLSDICDAVTTHTAPDRFWVVVKDSRSGAFGVIGLIMCLGGQVILFHEMLAAGGLLAILWAFMLGRAACVGFGYTVRHLARPGLGKLYMDGATLPVSMVTALVTVAFGLFLAGPLATIVSMVLAGAALYPLYRLAEKVDGANGDFLGCAVLLGELAVGLGFVLTL